MKRRILQLLGAFTLLVIVAGVAAPFLHANRYRNRIQQSLSLALQREVTVGEVRLDVFTGPGFSVRDVVIASARGSSEEPFAYVGEVRAVPRLWSLLSHRLEFSSLTLEDAHVNLTRTPGGWDFESLLRPGLLQAFPNLRLRGARINFKVGKWKNPFYLMETDLDVSPVQRDGSVWAVDFTGQPARTDRPAHGFGELKAKGRWVQLPNSPGRLECDATLERSELSDLVALLNGSDAGVRGLVSARVHVAGPASAAGLEGEVRISELHGWEESPPPGGVFAFRISGVANTQTQHLDLNAEPRSSDVRVKARLVVDGYLQNTAWSLAAHSDGLPIAPLPGLLRNFGVAVPDELRALGSLQGDLAYSVADGWRSQATVMDASLTLPGVAPLRFQPATVSLADHVVHLAPVAMTAETKPIGTVAGNYSLATETFQVDLTSDGAPLEGFLHAFPGVTVPLLSGIQKANWTGELHVEAAPGLPRHWSGTGKLTDGVANLPWLAEPLDIHAADVQLDGDAIQMKNISLLVDGTQIRGEYHYLPLADRPHEFRLAMDTLDTGEVEKLFRPVLHHRGNLLDLALGRFNAAPDWLRSFHPAGTVQVDALLVGGSPLTRFRSRVQWDGTQIQLADLQSRVVNATLGGRVTLDLKDSTPRYNGALRLANLEWQGGTVNGDFSVQSNGNGIAVLRNMSVTGTFAGRNLELEPLGAVEEMNGEAAMSWRGNAPSFRFPQLRLLSGDTVWVGTGASQANSDVVLQLSTNGKQLNLVGSLLNPTQPWVER